MKHTHTHNTKYTLHYSQNTDIPKEKRKQYSALVAINMEIQVIMLIWQLEINYVFLEPGRCIA